MGITVILRRTWLFNENKIKSSESFSKQPTQLIIAAVNWLTVLEMVELIADFCLVGFEVKKQDFSLRSFTAHWLASESWKRNHTLIVNKKILKSILKRYYRLWKYFRERFALAK